MGTADEEHPDPQGDGVVENLAAGRDGPFDHGAVARAVVKGVGEFYCSLLERCTLVDGKRRMGPSFFPELGSYNEYNVAYDIHFVLQIARQAAELKGDSRLQARFHAVIQQVPT